MVTTARIYRTQSIQKTEFFMPIAKSSILFILDSELNIFSVFK